MTTLLHRGPNRSQPAGTQAGLDHIKQKLTKQVYKYFLLKFSQRGSFDILKYDLEKIIRIYGTTN